MANWVIKNSRELEEEQKELVAKYGVEGYNLRKSIAQDKILDLQNHGRWEEAMFYGPQFETMAMIMSEEVLTKARSLKPDKWIEIFSRMALK